MSISILFRSSMGSSLKYRSIMKRMYFTPAWMFGSTSEMLPTFSSFPGWRHDLHHADRAHRTLDGLVQRRFLVALRCHQQEVDLVLRPVLLEDLAHRRELPPFGVSRGVFHVFDVLEIAALDSVSERRRPFGAFGAIR